MLNKLYKNGFVLGIVILFIGACVVPGISSKTVNPDSDKIFTNNSSTLEDGFATLTFNTFDENGKNENEIELPVCEAKYIFNLFEELKYKTISEPNSQETLDLKNEFIELMEEYNLIPGGMSTGDIQPLINPHGSPDNQKTRGKTGFLDLIFDMLFSKRNNHFGLLDMLDYPSEWNIVCNIIGGGTGIALPLFLLPRPRFITVWGASAAETITGSLVMPKSYIASGSQQGICLGFVGVGLTIAFVGFMGFGMIGYAMYTAVQATMIEGYNNN